MDIEKIHTMLMSVAQAIKIAGLGEVEDGFCEPLDDFHVTKPRCRGFVYTC